MGSEELRCFVSKCEKKLLVCVKGKSCSKRNSSRLFDDLKRIVDKFGLNDIYKVKKTDCFGLCKYAPIIAIAPDGCKYGYVGGKDIKSILKRHVSRKKATRKAFIIARSKKN